MGFTIEAACGSNVGKIRNNNEDNFFFDGKYMNMDNKGLEKPLFLRKTVERELSCAVFDGMGGENFGEVASFVAARNMKWRNVLPFGVADSPVQALERLVMWLNSAVVQAKSELQTNRMGTTMVSFRFSQWHVLISNVGDSRAYRLRNGELTQLSVDHVERFFVRNSRKAPLTQHLGINPYDMIIEPHIRKERLNDGDVYLLCSDGLTDMLSDAEISRYLQEYPNPTECVMQLIQSALDHGGRDNVTVIVCRVCE